MRDLWTARNLRRRSTINITAVPSLPDEFVAAYVQGKSTLNDMPALLCEMSLVHANSILETYIADLLERLFTANPKMMLSPAKGASQETASKKIDIASILEADSRGESAISTAITQTIRKIMGESTETIFRLLRTTFGLKSLSEGHDKPVALFSLARNCVVHNACIAGSELEKASGGLFQNGSRIIIDRLFVMRAIAVFRVAAEEIDSLSTSVHSKAFSK